MPDLANPHLDVELFVEPQRRAIAHARLADREVEPLRGHVAVQKAQVPQVRDASDLGVQEIVRVIDDVLHVRFTEPYALPVLERECLHGRQVSRLAWCLLLPAA